jgi:hypothetical protein
VVFVVVFSGVMGLTGLVLWAVATGMVVRARGGGPGVRVWGQVSSHGSYHHHGQLMQFARYSAVIDGRQLSCDSSSAGNWSPPPIGTPVQLLYVPGDPQNPLRETGVTGSMVAAIVLYGVGALLVGIAAVVVFGAVLG